MDDKPVSDSGKPDRSREPTERIGLLELQDYYLDRADEGKRQAVEAQLQDPKSEVNALLRWLRQDWCVETSIPGPDFPRLAELPAAELKEAETRWLKLTRASDKPRGLYPRIRRDDPDVHQR